MTKRQQRFLERFQEGFEGEGMRYASFGPCYGEECCEHYSEEYGDEGHFSHSSCGICGCPLGGTRYVWHWVDEDGELMHESDGCMNCLMLSAHGEVPEDEYLDWIAEEVGS